MKPAKQLLLINFLVISSFISYAQNVGIGTTTPATKLQVFTSDASYGMTHTNGTVTVGTYIGSNAGWLGTSSNHPLYFFTNNSGALTTLGVNGYFGIGTTAPVNKLQIGVTPGFSANDIAIGNGTQAMSFFQSSTVSNWYTNTNFALMPFNGGNGYVGIGIQNPVNKLQIGDVGSTGYSGNALVIGAVGTAMAINQTVLQGTLQSSTNLYFKPLNGSVLGHIYNSGSEDITGDVNVTGNATISGDEQITGNLNLQGSGSGVPLTVSSWIGYTANNNWTVYGNTTFPPAIESINAAGNVIAPAFVAISDARVKDIDKVSNSARDLETLKAIEVTDYTMKDKIMNGNRPFKKVIAQQVEKVYPEVVNKSVNAIPNVYQLTSKIEKTPAGTLLYFKESHHISRDAAKLKVIDKDGSQQLYNIIDLPSDKEVLISAAAFKGDTVFVYGEEVNDFRTVDYDGLTTLNISATQELSKLVDKQQLEIDQLNAKISALEKIIRHPKKKHHA